MRSLAAIFFCFAIASLTVIPAGSPALGQVAQQPLLVAVKPAQQPLTTVLNSMVVVATVTSGGQPVAGATVSFNDTFVSAFHDSKELTNSTGVAVTEMVLINPNPKNDTITATATASGYAPANGTTVVYVLPLSVQQLAVTATVVNNSTSGGSSEVVQGQVGTVYSSSTKWNGVITGVQDAKVVLSDGIGSSFPSETVNTDEFGFYSANFTLGEPSASTLDVVSVSVSAQSYNGSESTVEVAVGPYGPKSLTVSLDWIYPSTYSTLLNFATIQAHVTSGGTPVAGVPVEFSDTLGALFSRTAGVTDASGVATTTVNYIYQSTGIDLFTARASGGGFELAAGSNTLNVRPIANNQLSVSEEMVSIKPAVGTTDRVDGMVGWVTSSTSYAWSPTQRGVSGASVIVSDSQGSFAPFTIVTNAQGVYSATIPVPPTAGRTDVIEVSASAQGFKGSASSLFIVPAVAQAQVATNSSSATSSTTSTLSAVSSSASSASASSAESSTTSGSTEALAVASNPDTDLLAVVVLVVALVVVFIVRPGRQSSLPYV